MSRLVRQGRRLLRLCDEEAGVTQFIAMLLIMSLFVIMAFAPILYHISIMRQTTLELAHHRALQLASERGHLTGEIMTLIRRDLEDAGFPTATFEGVTYPAFPNSTVGKVLRGGNVHVELKYPAPNLDQLFGLIGGTIDGPGFYLIQGDERSEALE
jgi:hypothetical protein